MGKIGNPAFIPDLIRVINETDPLDFIFSDAVHALQCIDDAGHHDILTAIKEGQITEPLTQMDLLQALPYGESFDIAYQLWNPEDGENDIDSFETYAHTLAGIVDIRGIEALQDILFEGNAIFVGNSLETLCILHEVDIPELSIIHKQREVAQKRRERQWKDMDSLGRKINAPSLLDPITDFTQPSNVGTIKRDTPKVGRNDPCPCGSGKKYKKCCL